ncbi:hypothetical protein F511_43231 [Dorcoceras hygrometricum]|uniref:Uncharacterized protein n=1 Tax=Dorcoceras hygrometricum TaxID=472368 RepID=A0A2Z7CC05_9LAMI|nr:hypothetical protein F511_43231 [Dorcoceras hygrometricum]
MTHYTNQNPNPSLNCAAPPLFSQAAAAVCAAALFAGKSFRPTRRGESVRADLNRKIKIVTRPPVRLRARRRISLKRINARDSRAGRATLASSSAIDALLIGRDLRALSRMAGIHAARGATPRRALAAQLEADDVAPLRAWLPVAVLELPGRWIAHRGAAWSTLVARQLHNDARAYRDGVRPCAARKFVVAAVARPPLQRYRDG